MSTTLNAAGVKGLSYYGVTNGVWGENLSTATNATGVFGLATIASTTGPTVGVWGRSQSTTAGSIGTYGEAAAANAYGVAGHATGAGGIGIFGSSTGGVGIYGLSTGSYGIVGVTTAGSPYSGITGSANTPGAAAFAGGTSTPGCYAAYFTGPVVVDGSFTVVNPVNKHGAIKHPDGSYRLLYSMESPEAWIEDFGTGQLVNGQAAVHLEPDFAAVVQTDAYHVFLTMYDSAHVLYVTNRTAGGFVVQAGQAGASGAFSWRVVAKPKSEQKAARLGTFTIPTITLPDVASLGQAAPSRAWVEPTEPKQPAVPSAPPAARPAPTAAAPAPGSGATTPATNPVQPAPPPRP
jgi:hypothetical protein